jgi:hypothetical protein
VAFHRALAPTSRLPRAVLHTLSYPLPPLHSLPFSPSHRGSSSSAGKTYPTSMRTPMEVVAPGGLTAAWYPHGGPVACWGSSRDKAYMRETAAAGVQTRSSIRTSLVLPLLLVIKAAAQIPR